MTLYPKSWFWPSFIQTEFVCTLYKAFRAGVWAVALNNRIGRSSKPGLSVVRNSRCLKHCQLLYAAFSCFDNIAHLFGHLGGNDGVSD